MIGLRVNGKVGTLFFRPLSSHKKVSLFLNFSFRPNKIIAMHTFSTSLSTLMILSSCMALQAQERHQSSSKLQKHKMLLVCILHSRPKHRPISLRSNLNRNWPVKEKQEISCSSHHQVKSLFMPLMTYQCQKSKNTEPNLQFKCSD
jgi:hypothetical protein